MIKLYKGKFELGQLVMTRGVNDRVADDSKYAKFVHESIQKHFNCVWGDLCQEDKDMNDSALNTEQPDRIFSAYEYNGKSDRIYIITEWDRSSTCIMFPSEY
jgi:hypothetical protein